MTGCHSGVVTEVKRVAHNCTSTHCFIHRESLVSRSLSKELGDVLTEVVKMVNFVKSSALNSRLFKALCEDMGADYKQLLLHAEVRWLSRGKVLSRVYALRKEIECFLKDRKPLWAGMLSNKDWLAKLAYLSDIFTKLNELNLSMQGKYANILSMTDKIEGFKAKLPVWRKRVTENCLDMFSDLSEIVLQNGAEIDIESLKGVIMGHLKALTDNMHKYFPADADPRVGNEWIRNPFAGNMGNLGVELSDKLLELSEDSGQKLVFESYSLGSFWLRVKSEYPDLSRIALKVLIPFPSTYLCETGFSMMTVIKTKYRNRLDISSPFRVALSGISPRISLLSSKKEAHL
jgi:hypothetical protein